MQLESCSAGEAAAMPSGAITPFFQMKILPVFCSCEWSSQLYFEMFECSEFTMDINAYQCTIVETDSSSSHLSVLLWCIELLRIIALPQRKLQWKRVMSVCQ